MVEVLEEISDELKLVYKGLCDFTLSLGDDVNQKQLKLYSAFRRIKNFATVTPQKKNFVFTSISIKDRGIIRRLDQRCFRDRTLGHRRSRSVDCLRGRS